MTRKLLREVKEEIKEHEKILSNIHSDQNTIWYLNKRGFKKAEIQVTSILTKERIHELRKCKNDVFYFIENYLWIRSREKDEHGNRIWPFNLRSYQREQVNLYLNHKKVALLYPRRAGKTSGTVAYALWRMIFERNYQVICFANIDKTAVNLVKELKTMLEYLPLWMSEGIVKMNEHEIIFENGSWIKASATTESAGRSDGCSLIIEDEVAFVKPSIYKPFYSSLIGTMTESTQIIATSTPDGLNHWWKTCEQASEVNGMGEIVKYGRNGYVLKQILWNQVPTGSDPTKLRDEKFKQTMIDDIGEDAWLAEYEAEFIGSAGTLLSSEILKSFAPIEPIGLIKYLKNEFELKIYVKPIPKHRYCLVHDPAMGHGNDKDDNTGIHVLDVTNPFAIEQCAVMYRNDIDPLSAPYVLEKICRMYNNAFEISERNKCESIPQKLLVELDYDNLYIDLDKNIAGLYMTESIRNMSLSTMQKLFKNGRVIVHDYDFVHELSVFVKRGQKYQADEGEHDDLVTSFMLFCFLMSDAEKFEEYFGVKINYVNDLMDVGTSDQYIDIVFDDGSEVTVISSEESWDDWDDVAGDGFSDDDWF